VSCGLDQNKIGIVWRAMHRFAGFGAPENHGDGSALPRLVQSANLSLEIPGHRMDVG
jgi:hypothetical protein